MVPAAFVVLPALPLTGSGKIDHQVLPNRTGARAPVRYRSRRGRRPSRSSLAIVAELLALPALVGVSDNFLAPWAATR